MSFTLHINLSHNNSYTVRKSTTLSKFKSAILLRPAINFTDLSVNSIDYSFLKFLTKTLL